MKPIDAHRYVDRHLTFKRLEAEQLAALGKRYFLTILNGGRVQMPFFDNIANDIAAEVSPRIQMPFFE